MRKATVWSIWAYLVLLIFEGALRKWVLPGMADAILIIRDPVVLLIYGLALSCGIVPRTVFMPLIGLLVIASIGCSMLAGQTHPLVIAYGLRTNFLHLPLIWVMAEALDRKDVNRMGNFLLLTAIAMTVLMAVQYKSPRDAFVNLGVGGDADAGIYGALGKNRPPGFFSFITGIMMFFPLAAAFFLNQATAKRHMWWPLLLACGLCIIIALPLSISRGAMIATCFVGVSLVIGMLRCGQFFNATILRTGLMAIAVLIGLSFLPIFAESREVFMARWETAADESGGQGFGSLVARVGGVFDTTMQYVNMAPFFGYGIGYGSNVAAKILTGERGFLLAEDEWGKCVMELGPLLGFAFIGFRIIIAIYLLVLAWRAIKEHKDTLPFLIWTAAAPPIVFHQWAPPTILGFAVIGGGLLLASLNYTDDEEDEDEESSEENSDDDKTDKSADESDLDRHRRRRRGIAS